MWNIIKPLAVLSVFVGGLIASHGTTYAITDVPADHAHVEKFQHLLDIGVMSYQGNGTFQPNRTLSRAEALTLALRAASVPIYWNEETDVMPFSDVHSDWQYSPIATALRAKIITSAYPNFEPDAPVTKAQFIQWMVQASKIDTHPYRHLLQNLATDVPADSPYARSFSYAKMYHIVHLHPDGAFHILDTISRGEAAVYVYRHREVIHSDGAKKQHLKMRAAMQNYLSALRGGDTKSAELHAISLRDYARTIINTQSDDNALAADALSRSVEHFTTGMRAFSYDKRTTGYAELLLALKQAERAQNTPSDLSSFAAELHAVINESLEAFALESAPRPVMVATN